MTEQDSQIVEAERPGNAAPATTETRTYTRRELLVRQAMFYGGILLWVLILMIPLSVFMLSILGEFSVGTGGDYPGAEVRVWMVMERDERGIAYSRPQVTSRSTTEMSVQTNVRYMLWEGEGELIRYCQTYMRAGNEEPWNTADGSEGRCPR